MSDQTYTVPQSATEILGDLTALAEQLGGPDGVCQLTMAAALVGSPQINSLADLERFLDGYTASVLIRYELPAVLQAFAHVSRGHIRELIALDQQLAQVPRGAEFTSASAHVGQTQLRRLRPLRTERVVQRYLAGVESGQAKAWHTLVFGLVLAVYSLPLRQGLLHFAQQTLGGFVHAAGRRLSISEAQRGQLLSGQAAQLSVAIEEMLSRWAPVATGPLPLPGPSK